MISWKVYFYFHTVKSRWDLRYSFGRKIQMCCRKYVPKLSFFGAEKSLDFRAKISDKNNHIAHFWTLI